MKDSKSDTQLDDEEDEVIITLIAAAAINNGTSDGRGMEMERAKLRQEEEQEEGQEGEKKKEKKEKKKKKRKEKRRVPDERHLIQPLLVENVKINSSTVGSMRET